MGMASSGRTGLWFLFVAFLILEPVSAFGAGNIGMRILLRAFESIQDY